jgi:Putative viral replication protein.
MTSLRWVFTINNPTEDDDQRCANYAEQHCKYLVVGKETGDTGTPHLQGFLILNNSQRLSHLRSNLSARGHYEPARGTSQQASNYCKKDGDFNEFGALPSSQGKRSDFDQFRAWVEEQTETPNEREIARAFPGLFTRYKQRLIELVKHLRPQPVLCGGTLHEWQRQLHDVLVEEPNDRSIIFTVDSEGNKGKTWFAKIYDIQISRQSSNLAGREKR